MVRPVLVYEIPTRRPQTSWRSWGGIQTEQDATGELARIEKELNEIKSRADFPLDVAKPVGVRNTNDVAKIEGLDKADVCLVYAAGGPQNAFDALGKRSKNMLFFCRHKSGPVYLWYEIVSPRYLRQHTDALKIQGLDDGDVVVDNQDEILWRLRALCGLQNTLGTRILAVGGPGAWAQPGGVVPNLVKQIWKFDIQTVSYDDLGKLIKEARADSAAVSQAKERAAEYLKEPGVKLETKPEFVENAFLLEQVFVGLMKKADCQAITINGCMGTIMPMAETTACLTLSLLNDDGYMAFCESDFVVIPSGMLLANISGKPYFMNDPTYPHDGVITLAHCTGPRRMDGKNARAGPDPDALRVGLRGGPQGRDAQGPGRHEHRPRLPRQALGRREGRDRRCPVPAHLPLPDRHPLHVRQQAAGRADAGLPLDDLLRRLHEGNRLRLQEDRHQVGEPDGVNSQESSVLSCDTTPEPDR